MTTCFQDLKQVEGKNSDLIESPPEKIGEANDGGIGKIKQEGGDDAYVFDVDARVMQIGRENGIFIGSMTRFLLLLVAQTTKVKRHRR